MPAESLDILSDSDPLSLSAFAFHVQLEARMRGMVEELKEKALSAKTLEDLQKAQGGYEVLLTILSLPATILAEEREKAKKAK